MAGADRSKKRLPFDLSKRQIPYLLKAFAKC